MHLISETFKTNVKFKFQFGNHIVTVSMVRLHVIISERDDTTLVMYHLVKVDFSIRNEHCTRIIRFVESATAATSLTPKSSKILFGQVGSAYKMPYDNTKDFSLKYTENDAKMQDFGTDCQC